MTVVERSAVATYSSTDSGMPNHVGRAARILRQVAPDPAVWVRIRSCRVTATATACPQNVPTRRSFGRERLPRMVIG